MKRLVQFVLVLLMLGTVAFGAGKPEGPSHGPAETAQAFYHFYLRALDAGQNPVRQRAHEARQLLTPRLYAQLRAMPRGAQAAYVLASAGRDQGWGERLWVKGVTVQGHTATGTVRFRELLRPAHELRVALVLQGGRWKVDAVAPKTRA